MNSPLEIYLNHVHRALWCVPFRWRNAQIAEIRQHLTTCADELRMTGATQTEAEEEAVRRFGNAPEISRCLAVIWWRQLFLLDGPGRYAAGIAVVGTLLVVPLEIVSSRYLMGGTTQYPSLNIVLKLLFFFFIGATAGKITRRRAGRGALWGSGLTILVVQNCYRFEGGHYNPQVVSLSPMVLAVLAALWMGTQVAARTPCRFHPTTR